MAETTILAKWESCIFIAVLLMARKSAESVPYRHDRQATVFPAQSNMVPTYWEDILREFIFKTISPPPPANNGLYKRILEAPFYGGPLPTFPQDATSVVLSRGDVFYNPVVEGWLLCQEGCSNCEACQEQRTPTVKWVLRRIKRQPAFGPSRQDLQLTIIPQDDDSFHMKNLGPRPYIYVTSQTDQQQSRDVGMPRYSNWRNVPPYDTDSLIDKNYSRPGQPWRLVERNTKDEGKIDDFKVATEGLPEPTTTASRGPDTQIGPQENVEEQKHRSKNLRRRSRHRTTTSLPSSTPRVLLNDIPNPAVNNDTAKTGKLSPRIIMGIDQHGQKHLIHVVLAEDLANEEIISPNPLTYSKMNGTAGNGDSQSSYERLYHRIIDSLNTHKRSIEKFLETPKDNAMNVPGESKSQNPSLPGLTSGENDTKKEEGIIQANNADTITSSASLIASKRINGSEENNQWKKLENSYGSDVTEKKEQRGNSTVGPEVTTISYNEIRSKPTSAQRRRQKTRVQRVEGLPEESSSRNRPRRIRITPLQPSAIKRIRAGQNYNESRRGYTASNSTRPLPSSDPSVEP